jgi:hypothetical protein
MQLIGLITNFYFFSNWGHGQTSNFSCAEPNANEVKQKNVAH